MADGLIIAAPRSGSGKTVLTLGLLAALKARGERAVPAKTGPDYIDTAFLARAAGAGAINLDPFAMGPARLRALAAGHARGAGLLLIEGVMGLFDGAASGKGSTADLAAILGLPVVLVVDASHQSHSVAALVFGFANWRRDVRVAGIILNRVAGPRHEAMLRSALEQTGIPCLGAVPRDAKLEVPERHLGLVLPAEIEAFESFVDRAATACALHIDLDAVREASMPLAGAVAAPALPPLGQITAIARDAAFAFIYEHMLAGWVAAGASLRFFSPLADQAPDRDADAVFLPGGYPELHGGHLAAANRFRKGLKAASDRGALIYGECGGLMVLGNSLTGRHGVTHKMTGLLPIDTRIDRPSRKLGYRHLTHTKSLPWPQKLTGHEFHYSITGPSGLPPLFAATDALGNELAPMGAIAENVMGSYAHVIAPSFETAPAGPQKDDPSGDGAS